MGPAEAAGRGEVRGPGPVTTVIVGANGQLGRALQREFPDAVALDRPALDVTDARPSATTGGPTSTSSSTPPPGRRSTPPRTRPTSTPCAPPTSTPSAYLARAVRTSGATLVHISSEYVFDGTHDGPIPEDWPPYPLSVYGQSKADGDVQAAARRPSTTWCARPGWSATAATSCAPWPGSPTAASPRPWSTTRSAGRPSPPTSPPGIAPPARTRGALRHLQPDQHGEPASWADVAAAVFAARGRSADDVGRDQHRGVLRRQAAGRRRPLNSVLDLAKITATGFLPRDWRAALAEYLA